jgi:hypothetical protein
MNIRLFVAVPIAALTLFSCSKDNENLEQQVNTRKTAVTDYLDDFYDDPYTYGTPITTEDENGVEFSFKAITVDGEERGYLATNTAGTISYFADVDRTNHILTSYDFQSGEEVETLDIDSHAEYSSTNSFDFIEIIEDVNSGARSKSGRKFWGNKDLNDATPCIGGQKTVWVQHYVFWIKNGDPYQDPRPC